LVVQLVYRSYKLLSSYKLRSKTQVFQICSLWRERKTTLFLTQVLNLSKKRIRNKVSDYLSSVERAVIQRLYTVFSYLSWYTCFYKNLGKNNFFIGLTSEISKRIEKEGKKRAIDWTLVFFLLRERLQKKKCGILKN